MPQNKGSKPNNKNSKTISKIKSSVWDRSFSLTKLSVRAGATALKESILSLKNKTDDDPLWKNVMKEHAGTISRELGELKGSLMKAGQMMSMYGEYFLPPETNEVLKSLQSDSPPVAFEYIENIIRHELGDEKLSELEIENQSWATASLGQVHRAKIKATQEWIVLKVQYPRIEEAIDSDVAALKRLLQIMKLLPKEMAFESVFTEIKEMLHFETDYIREADFTEKFAKLLEQDQRFVVPKVYRRYSTKKILATSFERGMRADDPIIKSLPQDRRNRLAEAFLDLYFKELFQWRQMQTDPHAGNYRIRVSADGRDQIVLFDFGATREFPESFMNPYYRMIQASLRGDNESFNQAATEL
ncbi:MAG TPA: AarF/ABC1/UbiB kinase family protein [Pseudobdellovibrionaceae bacterium]|nr:AarF/ABC1/UbiB kinase family protein [Pseudobdellovibrionaceae bacterium]